MVELNDGDICAVIGAERADAEKPLRAEIERLTRERDVLGDAVRRRNERIEGLTAELSAAEDRALGFEMRGLDFRAERDTLRAALVRIADRSAFDDVREVKAIASNALDEQSGSLEEKRCVHGTPESQVCGHCCGYER